MGSSLFPVSSSQEESSNWGISADLIIVLFLNSIEIIDLEFLFGVVTVVGQELILHRQSGAS